MDDLKCKLKENVDVSQLWEQMNSFDSNIVFIFGNVSTVANFLDVSCSTKNDQLIFDIYHKPTNSFSYLHYCSCCPQHTKINTFFA